MIKHKNITLKVNIKNEDYNFYRYMYEFSPTIKLIVILKIKDYGQVFCFLDTFGQNKNFSC